MNGVNLLIYIDSNVMPRHHKQTIKKFHLQHKKLVIKVINTKPNKKCEKIKNQKYYTKCWIPRIKSDVRDLGKHGL